MGSNFFTRYCIGLRIFFLEISCDRFLVSFKFDYHLYIIIITIFVSQDGYKEGLIQKASFWEIHSKKALQLINCLVFTFPVCVNFLFCFVCVAASAAPASAVTLMSTKGNEFEYELTEIYPLIGSPK